MKIPFGFQIGAAVLAGAGVGKVLGVHAGVLGDLSVLFIQLLKTFASPLIFFAVVDSLSRMEIRAKKAGYLLAISLTNAIVAGVWVLLVSLILPHLELNQFSQMIQTLEKNEPQHLNPVSPHFIDTVKGFIPHHIFEPFISNNVISIVLLSILFGLTIKKLRKEPGLQSEIKVVEKIISSGLHLTQAMLKWIVSGIPFAVFGIIAKVVGTNGIGFFTVLGKFVFLITGIFIFYVGFYYSFLILVIVRKSPIRFYRQASDSILTAMGTGSSLATLPVTLRTLQEKMKVSAESSRLAACVGTNLNHDGILLYEAFTALFVAQIYGISLGLSQKTLLLVSSAVAALGIAGVPEAGLITLSVVLSATGLPLSFVPILTTVDWLIGRMRATVNVISDMVVATLLDRTR